MCPAETPEGHQVGLVKNLSLMTHITTDSDSFPFYQVVHDMGVVLLSQLSGPQLFTDPRWYKVFLNGNWVGITDKPTELVFNTAGSLSHTGSSQSF